MTRCCPRRAPTTRSGCAAERVWIVDPLDGTREFSELGRDDWAVHVALWQSGELVAGAVALPAQGITLATPDVAPPPPAPAKPAHRGVADPPAGHRARGPRRAGRHARRNGFGRSQSRVGRAGTRPTSTCTRAASTNGTPRHRSRWHVPPDCTRRVSTARRWNTTRPDPCCPTSSCADPNWPRPCWPSRGRPADWRAPVGRSSQSSSGRVSSLVKCLQTRVLHRSSRRRAARLVSASFVGGAGLVVRGPSGFNLEKVRRTAAVSGSQLSHYFADKPALIRGVLDRQIEVVLDFHRQPKLGGLDTFDDFERWADSNLRYLRATGYESPTYHTLAASWRKPTTETRQTLADGYWRWVALLEQSFQRMVDRGVLVTTAHPRHLALVVVCAHQGAGTMAFAYRQEWPLVDVTLFVVNYLRTFAADPAERPPRKPRRARRLGAHDTRTPQRWRVYPADGEGAGDPRSHHRASGRPDVRTRRSRDQPCGRA